MDNWLNWAATLMGVINAGVLVYAAWRKLKPEVKKMETENELDVLKGARESQQMLLDRINELKAEMELDKEECRREIEEVRTNLKAELEAEREARKRKVEYLERKARDYERDARDYRAWAAKLVKQVVEADKVPAPFIPSSDESETGIAPVGGRK